MAATRLAASSGLTLKVKGTITPNDVGALIQFALENMQAMVVMGDREYGTLTEPENESTYYQLKYAMDHNIS